MSTPSTNTPEGETPTPGDTRTGTPTPRTDAQMESPGETTVPIDFARTLERDLSTSRKELAEARASFDAAIDGYRETVNDLRAALTAANAEAERLRGALDLAGSQLEASADDCLHEHALRIKYEDMLQRWRKAMEPAVTLNADGAVSLTFTADQYAQLCRVRDEVDGAALAARKGTTT